MASTTETGHAKNVANFQTLIAFCKGYGTAYNPSTTALTVKELETLLKAATTALANVKTAKTDFDNCTNSRRQAFEALRPFSTSVVKAFSASDVPEQAIADAAGHNRKIQGKRAKTIKEPTPSQPPLTEVQEEKHISVSQQSYDSVLDNFKALVQTVAAQDTYKPNEPELTAQGLTAKADELAQLNNDVVNTFTGWSNERITRDQVLYNPLTGVNAIAKKVKAYVAAIYKVSSPQYKQISSLQFINVKTR